MKLTRVLTLAFVAIAIAGCSGGGGGTSSNGTMDKFNEIEQQTKSAGGDDKATPAQGKE